MANQIDDGGCAFPCGGDMSDRLWKPEPGMSLRDYFAGKALQAIISHTELVEDGKFLAGPAPGTSAIENFAEFSYLCADAMLAARRLVSANEGRGT